MTLEEDVVSLNEVVENLERAVMYVDEFSDNMVKHVINQMQFYFELNMVENVSYLPIFQMKNYSCGSKGTYAKISFTQLFCSNQMIYDVIKKVSEDFTQDVLDNMCDMLLTEFPTHRKGEQVALIKFKVDKKLVQMMDSETNVEATFQDIVSTLR